jgi:hypothetical protein
MTYLVVKTCKVLEVPDGDEPSRADSYRFGFYGRRQKLRWDINKLTS